MTSPVGSCQAVMRDGHHGKNTKFNNANNLLLVDTSILEPVRRKAIAEGLSNVLADTIPCISRRIGNVTGPMFQTLHLMFAQRMQVHEQMAWMLQSLLK